MTKLTTRHDLPGFNDERIAGMGKMLDVYLDGVKMRNVQTVDDERGYIDVVSDTVVKHGRPYRLIHRLFGKVELVWSERE